jgi:hypothetical protein
MVVTIFVDLSGVSRFFNACYKYLKRIFLVHRLICWPSPNLVGSLCEVQRNTGLLA